MVSRLIKRRTVANKISDKDRIFVNGNQAKAAKQHKKGDIITIIYAYRRQTVKILEILANNVSAQEAALLYEVIE